MLSSKRAFHRLPAIAVLILALAGCASLDPARGISPGMAAAEVMARYGQPVRVWNDVDGGHTLEYSQQPMGQHCYMVKIGSDERVLSLQDTLQQAGRERIQAGLTPEQVSRILGKERSRMFFRLSGEDVWDWSIPDEPGGKRHRFNVHFKDGVVLRTSYSTIFDDDRMDLFR
ncbi:outer membrane protein assembly factor BamE [Paucibacter sp. Y2R2-4]|uniref:outer membrane protein assembly factor BamE n=1 Tax=Paucibacter sp. Y2R2-4 TaxID=2893553 RepID=UPI0021E3EF52|nr:outer membrane protein assembly factor BamE [Paucibacter sp. Y2R2-4]MCV2351385.1 outer membrane protein assembly factor BamE [Paucibacter sp. Y2R2-4]